MNTRRVTIVILCEDSQHETFIRRFLKKKGWGPRDLHVVNHPPGKGSKEQWVREQFPKELEAYRERSSKTSVALCLGAAERTRRLREISQKRLVRRTDGRLASRNRKANLQQ